jgi:hypothetical protein
MWGALSDESMGLSFTVAAGLCQPSHYRIRVPLNSWPYFTVSGSRLPQPERPGPSIYIPQEQGVPVIPPGTGFPFRRLVRFTGLRWRHSTSPLHGFSLHYSANQLQQSQSCFTTGGLPPISSSWRQTLETHDQTFFFQLIFCGNSPYVTSSLTRRWVCLLWICLAIRQVYISHI